MEKTELDIPRLFGQNLQKYRKLAGLTQAELSKRLEITQKHLSIIETGTQFASASLISRICTELDIPPSALFGEDMNQEYFDHLYSRLATHMENKINWLKNSLSYELEQQLNEKFQNPNK